MKQKLLIGHIGALWSEKTVLLQKQKGDVLKATIFLPVFEVFILDFVTLSICLLGFSFTCFFCFVFAFSSSCCCFEKLVCVFWLLFHFIVLCFVFCEGLRVR